MSPTCLQFAETYRYLEWVVQIISSPDEATGELEKTWSLEKPNGVFESEGEENTGISMGGSNGSGVANRRARIVGV